MKPITKLFPIAICALSLIACGGDEDGTPPPSEPSPQPPPTSGDPPSSPKPPSGPPAPPPAPTVSCEPSNGSGTNGLQLYGAYRYRLETNHAKSSSIVTLDPGEIRFSNPNLGADATTGSLRAALWATTLPYRGGRLSGYRIATYKIKFSNGMNQLRNGQHADLIAHTLPARIPSKGDYCMTVTLEEYSNRLCHADDNFCIVDWGTFDAAVRFN